MFPYLGYPQVQNRSRSRGRNESDQLAAAMRLSQQTFAREERKRREAEQELERLQLQKLQLLQAQANANLEANNFANHEINNLSTFLQCVEWQSMFVNRGAGVGLRNLGNSCFLNATLQCLAYCPIFAQVLMQANHSKFCPKKRRRQFCTLCEMESFIPSMHVSKRVQEPKHLFRNLTKINNLLRVGCQEDAHEFVQSLLDRCEIAYDEQYQHQSKQQQQQNKANINNNKKAKKKLIDPQNPIRKLFVGEMKTAVTCKKCKSLNVTPEPFCCLSLEIADADSIDESLSIFSNMELMKGAEKYHCNTCKKRRLATKEITISKLPPVLMFHLKRFSFEFYANHHQQYVTKKIVKHIEFPLVIDFAEHAEVISAADRQQMFDEHDCRLYELCGVLVHSGPKLGCGHYYSLVKSPDGQWIKMNDSSATRVRDLSQVLKEQAYILFYRRKGSFTEMQMELSAMQDGPKASGQGQQPDIAQTMEQTMAAIVAADSSNSNSGSAGVSVDMRAVDDASVTDGYFDSRCSNPAATANSDRAAYVHVPPMASRPELVNNDNSPVNGNGNAINEPAEEIFWTGVV